MKEQYRTSDLPLAAFLFLKKARFLGLHKKDSRSYWFSFGSQRQCEMLANIYFAGRARVDARAFSDALRRAKDVVFSNERQFVA